MFDELTAVVAPKFYYGIRCSIDVLPISVSVDLHIPQFDTIQAGIGRLHSRGDVEASDDERSARVVRRVTFCRYFLVVNHVFVFTRT